MYSFSQVGYAWSRHNIAWLCRIKSTSQNHRFGFLWVAVLAVDDPIKVLFPFFVYHFHGRLLLFKLLYCCNSVIKFSDLCIFHVSCFSLISCFILKLFHPHVFRLVLAAGPCFTAGFKYWLYQYLQYLLSSALFSSLLSLGCIIPHADSFLTWSALCRGFLSPLVLLNESNLF